MLLGIFKNDFKLDDLEQRAHYAFVDGLTSLDKGVSSMTVDNYADKSNRSRLQNQLDETVNNILMFTGENLKNSTVKSRIYEECDKLKQALQELFKSYENKVISKHSYSKITYFFIE
jgi:hypothetical protein